jgi:hypothetical protein
MKIKEVLMSVDQNTKRPGTKLYSKGRAFNVSPGRDLSRDHKVSDDIAENESACLEENLILSNIGISGKGAVSGSSLVRISEVK